MLAKAVATEAGANFINISMSSITSKVCLRAYILSPFCSEVVLTSFNISVSLAVVW